MKTKILLLFAMVILPPSSSAANIVATINGKAITVKEFEDKYQRNLKFYRYNVPSKGAFLEDLIKRELGIQEAKRLGLEKNPEIEERMNTVLYHALLENSINSKIEKIHVSDKDAEKYYYKNPEIRTSHIFVALPPDSDKNAEERAKAKILKIQGMLKSQKMSFAEIAQNQSEDSSAPVGGDLDFQTKDRLDPKYYETARALAPGKVSDVIKTPFGYHIIKLVSVRPWGSADKAKIKRLVFEEEKSKLFESYMDTLKKKANISRNLKVLK